MKIIYSGLESSGKSYKLGQVAEALVERNSKWYAESGIKRKIYSNLEFSEKFKKYAEEKGIEIFYWKNLDELITIQNADIIMDEVGNYFDARGWENLSLDVRRWLTQGAKCGIEIYGSAQDLAQVDKSFRRLVNYLFHITKLFGSPRPSATKPPIKKIWGVCAMRRLDPRNYDEEKSKFSSMELIPDFFFIKKEGCEIFNTNQKIERSKPPEFKHETRYCNYIHEDGSKCNYKYTKHF